MRLFPYFRDVAFAARGQPGASRRPAEPSLPRSTFPRFPAVRDLRFRRSPTEGHTRSHSEHGSQASCRRWYLAPGPGRVGRRRIHGPPSLKDGGPPCFKRFPGRTAQGFRECPAACISRIFPFACSCRSRDGGFWHEGFLRCRQCFFPFSFIEG